MERLFNALEGKTMAVWNWITHGVFQGMDGAFSSSQCWFQRFWLGSLYLITLGIWAFFLNFGNFMWGVQDWIWEWRYSRILQEAITIGQLPLHTDPPLQFGISRFFGLPDVNLAPQVLLLRFLDPGVNFLVNTLLMVSVSYLGCLAIRRRYRLSLFSFTLLALLFNFNGFITAHIGIGHTFFTGYFFLPFFVLLILQLVDGQGSPTWFAQMGLVLFGIELLGSSRIFAACFLFMGILFLFGRSLRLELLKAMIAGVVLNVYRIAPAMVALPSVDVPPFAGFSTLQDLVVSMISIIPPAKSIVGLPIGWWEFDMYIGLLGLGWIAYFGLYRTWRPESGEPADAPYRPLMITMLVFAMFSIGYLYMPINALPLPILSFFRVPSRFFILPLLFLVTLAAIRAQAWLEKSSYRPWHYFILSILLVIFGNDILQHTRVWRVKFIFESFSGGSYETALDFSLRIANQIDPLYTNTLILSSIATLISIGYVLYLLLLGGKKAKKAQAG